MLQLFILIYQIKSLIDKTLFLKYTSGAVHQILDAHLHYVQGVAWDPLAQYVASISSDRTCRIYANKPQQKSKGLDKLNFVCQHVLSKAETLNADESKVCFVCFHSLGNFHVYLWKIIEHFYIPNSWEIQALFAS